MLFESSNEKIWKQFLAQPGIPISIVKGVKESLMKYKIDAVKWMINYECLERWDCRTSDNKAPSLQCAEIIQKYNSYDMPLYLERWFIAGYPDILLWLWEDENIGTLDELRKYENDPRFFSGSGTEPAGYNLMVDLYIKKTGLHPSLTSYNVF